MTHVENLLKEAIFPAKRSKESALTSSEPWSVFWSNASKGARRAMWIKETDG
jgi:hypothetical protein